MSVINRVLRDLDGNRAPRDLPEGVHSVVAAATTRRPLWPWLLALIAGLALFAFLDRPRPATAPSARPVAAQPAPPVQAVAPPTPHKAVTMPAPPVARRAPPAVVAPAQASPAATELPPPETVAQAVPVKPAEAPVRVIKEARPPNPREQAEAAYAKALRQVEAGRSRDAMVRLDEALALDPGHLGARQTAVALAQEAGDTARAEALLRAGLALHPGEPWLARSLGQLLVQRGEANAALEVLSGGLAKGDADYRSFYAGVLAKAGRTEAAVTEYRLALQARPDQGTWWLGLALALERQGRRAEAAGAYERAAQTRLNPELREFVSRKLAELN